MFRINAYKNAYKKWFDECHDFRAMVRNILQTMITKNAYKRMVYECHDFYACGWMSPPSVNPPTLNCVHGLMYRQLTDIQDMDASTGTAAKRPEGISTELQGSTA